MIKIENVDVHGFEAAIRGIRNPLNSWNKSDSCYLTINEIVGHPCDDGLQKEFVVGENDLELAKKLIKAGTDHSKFMRMITVTFDITMPMYFAKQFDTYKIGTVRNSTSTMHCIHTKEFTLDDFSYEHLITEEAQTEKEKIVELPYIHALKVTISFLNGAREHYLKTKDKKWWYQLIQLLPSSYNQRSTVQLNYAVLRNIYHSRKTTSLTSGRFFVSGLRRNCLTVN